MAALGILVSCMLAAGPGEAAGSAGGGLPPRRDVFGTAPGGDGRRVRSPGRVWGTVELSDGTRDEGWLSLAPGRPFEVYDLDREEWREFGMHGILGLRATPRKEELEREWRWKEYGKDEKVYTGRAYPKRWLDHELVVRVERTAPSAASAEPAGASKSRAESTDDSGRASRERIRCHIRGAVLYLTTEPKKPSARKAASAPEEGDRKRSGAEDAGDGEPRGREAGGGKPGGGAGGEFDDGKPDGRPPRKGTPRRLRFILRQYERGKLGQTLDDLVYVERVIVHERASAAGRREAKRHGDASAPLPGAR